MEGDNAGKLRQEMKEQMIALTETLGITRFNSTLSGEARREWQKAFAAYRRVVQTHKPAGIAPTTRLVGRDQNRIPASFEKLLWARVFGGSPEKDYFGLVEDCGEGAEWQREQGSGEVERYDQTPSDPQKSPCVAVTGPPSLGQ
ncbi:hypothetical protein NHX12_019084 [Muraenolepis orangiensis]|uniref:Uncharacterized protein n=1 Tax=Muraenolepis orangiensis TaxID=630683 RepID=A0A9Q0EW43_9TELE|nr:hypothetical protein NHX12_019084 [Muraenolepis orangiensis]